MSALPDALQRFLALPDKDRRLGPYLLKRQLGRGGFAPVWLAEEVFGDTTLRLAAVKLFAFEPQSGRRLSASARKASSSQPIIDEAQRLCQVEHPNIVRFYALPTDETLGIIGLAMEYVGGQALSERLKLLGKLPIQDVLEVGAAVASALSAVHRAGLVHRDVNPANIVLNPSSPGAEGFCKLIDFGIAAALPKMTGSKLKVRHALSNNLPVELSGAKLSELPAAMQLDKGEGVDLAFTLTALGGKLGYVDPVCWRELSPATMVSDLYGLGAVLYVCLAGRIPAAGTGSLQGEILRGEARAPKLTELLPGVPPELAQLVDALLEPDPQKRPQSAEMVAIELERLKTLQTGHALQLPPEDEGPFRGLGRFEQRHRDVFFGRRVDIAATLEMMRRRGLVALVGPSGCGKSSLARAGVLPAVTDGALGGPKTWETVIVTPGVDPRSAVGAALFYMLDSTKPAREVVATMINWLHNANRGLVLLIDQLEELATLATVDDRYTESRRWMIDLLTQLGQRPLPNARVLVTARRDMLDPILAHRDLGRVMMRGTVLVTPLMDAAWGDVMDAALEMYGYDFEDDSLRQELLKELSEMAQTMPLVQFALTRLWGQRDVHHKKLTRAGLQKIGGIAGALERYAEATFEYVVSQGALESTLRHLFLALTTPEGARRTSPAETLMGFGDHRDEQTRQAIEQLEQARLLVREQEGITLAHEALLDQWGRLRSWLAEVRQDRLLAEQIEQAARHWIEDHRDHDLLWKKRRLIAAEELIRRGGMTLSKPAMEFIRACQVSKRRQWVATRGFIVVMAMAISGMLIKYVVDTEEKERSLQDAKARAEANAQDAIEQKDLVERAKYQEEEARKDADKAKEETISLARKFESQLKELEQRLITARTEEQRALLQAEIQARKETAKMFEQLEPEIFEPSPPAEPPLVSVPEPTNFNRAVAYIELQDGADRASYCKDLKGPRGSGRVSVVFDPSGFVNSVKVDPRFEGTEVGKCVEGAFLIMKLPPFVGSPVAAAKSFKIR